MVLWGTGEPLTAPLNRCINTIPERQETKEVGPSTIKLREEFSCGEVVRPLGDEWMRLGFDPTFPDPKDGPKAA